MGEKKAVRKCAQPNSLRRFWKQDNTNVLQGWLLCGRGWVPLPLQGNAVIKNHIEGAATMSTAIIPSNFIQPHFIECLGEDGLTAHEIALSLDVDLKHVHEKLRRGKWFHKDTKAFRVVAYTTMAKSKENFDGTCAEREFETFALSTSAAKAFVARWENFRGDGYLNYLFECESILPEALAKLKDTTEKLKAAEYSVIKSTKKLRSAAKEGMLLAPVYTQTIFGLQLEWKMMKETLISEMQRIKAKARHARKTLVGLTARVDKLESARDRLELEERNCIFQISQGKDPM
jgi:hypothetical protein